MPQSIVYRSDVSPRKRMFAAWEKQRNRRGVHWAIECFAEALGVFFYTYAGIGATIGFVVGNILGIPGLSSILQAGLGYMGGILLAIVICAPTSGGHFNPCVSISYAVFRGFPPLKALRYIVAQILGAYIACALVYSQYKEIILECEGVLLAAGKLDAMQFTPEGPAGIFALYLPPGQTLGRIFLNEFVTDVFLGLTIWAAIDPSNPLIPPVFGPMVVSLAYACAIWGFALSGIAANSARDVGARLFAMSIWGIKANGGAYAAIAALTNIPATLFAALLYELFLADSDRVVPSASLEAISVHTNHRRHLQETQIDSSYPDSPSKMEMQIPGDKSSGLTYEHLENATR